MTVHLKKLSVGSESLAGLRHWQAERVRNGMELMHVTRNTPRRAEEVLDGGSIFWVIKGVMCARQPITELRSMQRADGKPACGIVLAPELVAVEPLRVRIFQGWRYLEVKDAPVDIPVADEGGDTMPPELVAELRELGLLWQASLCGPVPVSFCGASPMACRTVPATCHALRPPPCPRHRHNLLNSACRPRPAPVRQAPAQCLFHPQSSA